MLITQKILTLILVVCFLSSTVLAQDPNTVLMKKLYTKIAENVAISQNDPTTGQTYLVLANTGILLDPDLDYDTPEGRSRFARVIDKVINPNWIYGSRNYTVFDVYNRMLIDHEAADIKPTAAQIAQYKQACKKLYTDCDEDQPGTLSPALVRYNQALKTLTLLEGQAEVYQRVHKTQDLPPDLAAELGEATNKFELMTGKGTIEGALAIIRTFERIDPNAYWGELTGRFLKNTQTSGSNRFGKLDLYPSYKVWLDMNRTWTKLGLTQSEIEKTTSSSHTSVGGGGGFSFGFWSVGANYNNLEDRTFSEEEASNYKLSMELMRVNLDRPWMDASVFESTAWKFLKGSPYFQRQISSGADALSGISPPNTDIMPFVPTGLLLARRVSISADFKHDLETSFRKRTSGGGSVGWGFWSLSGRSNSDQQNTFHKAKVAGNTITFDDPQVLGFFVQVLPQTPQPHRCYRFPSSSQPLPPDCQTNFTFSTDKLLKGAKERLRNAENFKKKNK